MFLRSQGAYIAMGSGFPQSVVETIIGAMGWRDKGLVDFYSSAEQVP